ATNREPSRLARSRASVVLPVPGGPQRIREGSFPPRRKAWPSRVVSPTNCSCPMYSSSPLGLIRSASGALARSGLSSASGSSNKLPVDSRGMVDLSQNLLDKITLILHRILDQCIWFEEIRNDRVAGRDAGRIWYATRSCCGRTRNGSLFLAELLMDRDAR